MPDLRNVPKIQVLKRNMRTDAWLENAHNVCRSTPLNSLAMMTFELPYNDSKLAYCKMRRFVRVAGSDTVYRIFKCTKKHGAMATIECEHASATLMDEVIDDYIQIGNLGTYTSDVIQFILNKQTTQNWVLGRCDFARQFEYGFDNETLYSCLKSVSEPIADDYKWDFDTSAYPWVINLVKLDEDIDPQSYFWYSKNLRGITVDEDSTKLATQIKCLGWGEGINQLTISDVNDGSPYLYADQDAIDEYGLISYVWVDRRFTHAETLKARGEAILKGLQSPRRTYTLDVVDLMPITGNFLDEPRVGDITRCIDDELDVDIKTVITQVDEIDIFGKYKIKINIANTPEDIAGTIAEQQDRLRNEQLYSQGAKSIFVVNFSDNADQRHPAELDLFIPSDVVNINYVNILIRFAAFRAYSLTAASGGGSVRSTSTQPSQTSSSGGGNYSSTTSAGGQSTSTTSGGGYSSNVTSGSSSTSSTSGANFIMADAGDTGFTYLTYTSGMYQGHKHILPNVEYSISYAMQNHWHGINHNHSVYVSSPSHSHNFSFGGHSHNVSIAAHTHSIGSHSHTVDIQAHVHPAVYGIFEGARATSATVTIDGRQVSIPIGQDFDITNLLSVDTSGKIKRGATQQVRIAPNNLTRITATATVGLFTGSHAGVAA